LDTIMKLLIDSRMTELLHTVVILFMLSRLFFAPLLRQYVAGHTERTQVMGRIADDIKQGLALLNHALQRYEG